MEKRYVRAEEYGQSNHFIAKRRTDMEKENLKARNRNITAWLWLYAFSGHTGRQN